ncbi:MULTISPECIES: YfgM family protein [Providencia]|uniref:YfgM family protein n=1 Tax=Providencia TaxID=586 RepID=UPI0019822938|nr:MULTISPECIES: YfgM family protein [Providencia]MBN4863651.1 YfgM family protein [Providencia stuartii]MBN4872973.1 YfgM family protein [Providencia stuartii]MBN4877906.1 YfgM family protein [Providencia stuartii]MBN4882174.1 YfgM family protein [Providencia stuartii]
MEVYTNENDQVDAIKRFFANYGAPLVIGLVIGVGGVFGWNYWQSHKVNVLQESAQKYETINTQLRSGSEQGVIAAQKFAAETDDVYSAMMGLELAQIAVDKGDLANAQTALSNALTKAKTVEMQDLINLRLARVQLAQGNADAAIASVANIKGKSWQATAQDVRGDALLHKGDKAGAKAAYAQGLESEGSQSLRGILTLKLNNVSNS